MNTSTVPSIVSTGWESIRFELRAYFRAPDTVFFTFLFPVLMLAIFGFAFESMGEIGALPDGTGGITMAEYYLPAMISAGIFLSGTQNNAIDIASEKHTGWLRRLGNTPLSPVSYFIGRAGMTLITALIQTAVIIAFAVLVFDTRLPNTADQWTRFSWLFILGIFTMTLLGIALSALPRSAKSATAVVIPLVLILMFVSGIYLQFEMLPEWLKVGASIFPLKWLAQGMRSVFLPEHFEVLEMGGTWDLNLVLANLAVWIAVGLVISLATFRWVKRS